MLRQLPERYVRGVSLISLTETRFNFQCTVLTQRAQYSAPDSTRSARTRSVCRPSEPAMTCFLMNLLEILRSIRTNHDGCCRRKYMRCEGNHTPCLVPYEQSSAQVRAEG